MSMDVPMLVLVIVLYSHVPVAVQYIVVSVPEYMLALISVPVGA